jgi:hypothetical protein
MNLFEVDRFERWRPRLRLWGVAALAGSVVLAAIWPQAFFRGYLAAFVYWLQFPLGAAALVMIHALIGGRWFGPVRAALIAMAPMAVLAVVFFLPVAGGVVQLYDWAGRSAEAQAIVGSRGAYLNLPFFFGRSGIYLLLWAGGAWLLARRGRGGSAHSVGGGLAAAGLLAYVLTASFAAIDWVGSLEARWYSSIFGLYLIIGQVVAALAIAICLAVWKNPQQPKELLHDLGTLLLAFVALHAYFAYSQFFIIWNGNLPHEISWYVPRMHGVWGVAAAALMLLHFGLPFALLLFRANKRRARTLAGIACWLLLMRWIEALWMVIPSRPGGQVVAVIAACVAFVGMGCAWALVFAWQWRRRPGEVEIAPAAE